MVLISDLSVFIFYLYLILCSQVRMLKISSFIIICTADLHTLYIKYIIRPEWGAEWFSLSHRNESHIEVVMSAFVHTLKPASIVKSRDS